MTVYFACIVGGLASLCWYFWRDIARWWDEAQDWRLERDGSVNERMDRLLRYLGENQR